MSQQNFLTNSQCGRDGKNVLVCCPNTLTINDLRPNEQCKVQVLDKSSGGGKNSTTNFPWYEILSIDEIEEFICIAINLFVTWNEQDGIAEL